ncbi:hypothetical protein FISHEDRAFT_55276 [Fistulina hepatica ATCC 64428]|uniref:Secreted protein n=1 Tax=Fistulina hepatica ATCC 64428 TaxID=1128425 RepID=A0A0D7APC8_9AGAR|nr:hypothetical protein FISHEDRAFT_55276 [Fistulina hepatica ATCC 64428]
MKLSLLVVVLSIVAGAFAPDPDEYSHASQKQLVRRPTDQASSSGSNGPESYTAGGDDGSVAPSDSASNTKKSSKKDKNGGGAAKDKDKDKDKPKKTRTVAIYDKKTGKITYEKRPTSRPGSYYK